MTFVFLTLFAFPLFPLHLTNFFLLLLGVLTAIAFILKPFPIGKILLLNLVFVLPFIPYLAEFLFTGFNPIAGFEFEKKLFFFTAPVIIPIFIYATGFRNYKLALMVFAATIVILTVYSFSLLLIKGIAFLPESYSNGAYMLRNNFEVFSGLHPTVYSIFAILSGCFFLNLKFAERKNLRIICYVLAGVLFISVLFVAARISIITGIACLIFIIIKSKSNWRKKLIFCVLTLFVMFLISYGVPSLKSRMNEFSTLQKGQVTNGNTLSQRVLIFDCTAELFMTNIYTGLGSRNFQKDLNNCYIAKGWAAGSEKSYDPHNQFLSVGLNYGLLMMMIFTVCLIFIFRKVFRISEGKYFTIAILIFFLSESLLEGQMGVYFFGLFSLLFYNLQPESVK